MLAATVGQRHHRQDRPFAVGAGARRCRDAAGHPGGAGQRHRRRPNCSHGAQTDPLTGLPNRSVLLERINDCCAWPWRLRQSPDAVLRRPRPLQEHQRQPRSRRRRRGADDGRPCASARRCPSSAIVARLSGDEYVVLDPSTRSRPARPWRSPSACCRCSASRCRSARATCSSPPASAWPRSAPAPAHRRRTCCATPTRRCTGPRTPAATAWPCTTSRCTSGSPIASRSRPRSTVRSTVASCACSTSRSSTSNTGDVVGFEALMRWQQADGTIVSPAEFIPIAEDTGTIVPIGSWALLEALTQLRRWIDDGVCSESATMSVNVSPRQLERPQLPVDRQRGAHPLGRVAAAALAGGHRERHDQPSPSSRWPPCAACGRWACASRSTTSAPATRRCRCCRSSRCSASRSTGRSCTASPTTRTTAAWCAPSSPWAVRSASTWSPKASRACTSCRCSATSAARKAQGFLISHPVPADAMRSTVAALERLGQFPGLRPNVSTPVNTP